MRIDILARSLDASTPEGMLAAQLAAAGHEVRRGGGRRYYLPQDWTADLILATSSASWRLTANAARQAGAAGRLAYWHLRDELPNCGGEALVGPATKGWKRCIPLDDLCFGGVPGLAALMLRPPNPPPPEPEPDLFPRVDPAIPAPPEALPVPCQARQEPWPARISIAIPTFERPGQLLALLQDLAGQDWLGELAVAVWQDGGSADYSACQALCAARRWAWHAAEHAGKRKYWRRINEIWADWQANPTGYLVQLADDFRLLPGGLRRLVTEWENIEDSAKAMLNPLLDSSRADKPCWTGQAPERQGNVDRLGWNDCAYLTTGTTLEALGWALDEIPESRWTANPTISSGVGQQISKRLLAAGWHLYGTGRSIVDHDDLGASQMNPRERGRQPMLAVGYGYVTASLASIPGRVEALRQVVGSLLPQVDRLNVYLNGYPDVPGFLDHSRICVARSQEHGDLGDAGKFFWSNPRMTDGWQLHCDDDLLYPTDWVRTMVGSCEKYGRKAVVSAHGAKLKLPIVSYYRGRTQYHCLRPVARDMPVHVVGTGVVCYHASTIRISPEDFKAPNMADIWFALAAQRQKVPLVVLSHAEGWLRDIPTTQVGSIYGESKRHSGHAADTADLQTKTVHGWSDWRIYQ